MKKPQTNQSKRPIVKTLTPEDLKWSFSFSYWKQHKFYGIGSQTPEWFAALFERLGRLSREFIKETFENLGKKDFFNLNKISFEDNRVKLQIDDFAHIPKVYLEDEYWTVFEFNIDEKSRVFGFFDERHVFNICYLDPEHSGVPVEESNYKQTKTKIAQTTTTEDEYAQLFEISQDENKELQQKLSNINDSIVECLRTIKPGFICPIKKWL